jgi:hypothetical protein
MATLTGTCTDTGIADANGNEIYQDDAGNQWYGDPGCGGNAGVVAAATGSNPGAGGAGTPATSWINSLGGLFGTIFRTANPPTVLNRGIPGSPGSLTPVQSTGVGTLLIIGAVVLLVFFGMRR